MEITKKKIAFLIISIFIIIGFYSYKKYKLNHFIYYMKGYRKIKDDLYKNKDSIYIMQNGYWIEKDDTIEICNHEDNVNYNATNKKLYQIMDVNTFKKVNHYYVDKNNVYFFNSSPAFFPSLNAITSKSKKIIFYGYDYISTDSKIYYQSNEIKNADVNTFIVLDSVKDGLYYSKDKNNYYLGKELVQKR